MNPLVIIFRDMLEKFVAATSDDIPRMIVIDLTNHGMTRAHASVMHEALHVASALREVDDTHTEMNVAMFGIPDTRVLPAEEVPAMFREIGKLLDEHDIRAMVYLNPEATNIALAVQAMASYVDTVPVGTIDLNKTDDERIKVFSAGFIFDSEFDQPTEGELIVEEVRVEPEEQEITLPFTTKRKPLA